MAPPRLCTLMVMMQDATASTARGIFSQMSAFSGCVDRPETLSSSGLQRFSGQPARIQHHNRKVPEHCPLLNKLDVCRYRQHEQQRAEDILPFSGPDNGFHMERVQS